MNKKFGIVIAIAVVILLYVFMSRKTVAASTSPAGYQPGIVAGGINFSGVDTATGLPIFDSSAPAAYVKGLAPDVGGTYQCGNGTTPALNASNGQVYCVIPAESGIFSSAAPVVAPTNVVGTPQGPTQSGGYLGQPTVYTPQGPTQAGGWIGETSPPTVGLPLTPTDPTNLSLSGASVDTTGDPTGLQSDTSIFYA